MFVGIRTKLCENRKDGSLLVEIPAGQFLACYKGHSYWPKGKPAAKGLFTVNLPAFLIGLQPVTNAQYLRFVKETGHRSPDQNKCMGYEPVWSNGVYPSGLHDHPVVGVEWEDAHTYCDWAGLRLPRDLEWERVARGCDDGRNYPWGDAEDIRRCRVSSYWKGAEETCSVWDYPAGTSPNGCLNMTGNVEEWVYDCVEFNERYYRYRAGDLTPSPPRTGDWHDVRGGSWRNIAYGHCSSSCSYISQSPSRERGFRVAKTLPEAP